MVVLQWVCPCGQCIDAAEMLRRNSMPAPSPGDLTMCKRCGEAFKFVPNRPPVRVAWSIAAQTLIAVGQPGTAIQFARVRELALSRGAS